MTNISTLDPQKKKKYSMVYCLLGQTIAGRNR